MLLLWNKARRIHCLFVKCQIRLILSKKTFNWFELLVEKWMFWYRRNLCIHVPCEVLIAKFSAIYKRLDSFEYRCYCIRTAGVSIRVQDSSHVLQVPCKWATGIQMFNFPFWLFIFSRRLHVAWRMSSSVSPRDVTSSVIVLCHLLPVASRIRLS